MSAKNRIGVGAEYDCSSLPTVVDDASEMMTPGRRVRCSASSRETMWACERPGTSAARGPARIAEARDAVPQRARDVRRRRIPRRRRPPRSSDGAAAEPRVAASCRPRAARVANASARTHASVPSRNGWTYIVELEQSERAAGPHQLREHGQHDEQASSATRLQREAVAHRGDAGAGRREQAADHRDDGPWSDRRADGGETPKQREHQRRQELREEHAVVRGAGARRDMRLLQQQRDRSRGRSRSRRRRRRARRRPPRAPTPASSFAPARC